MASIMTAIQLQDRMTPVLQNITTAMNLMVSSFQDVQSTAGSHIDTSSFDAIRENIHLAGAELTRFQEEAERAAQAPVQQPTPPMQQPVQPSMQWQSIATPEVFMNTGVERFESEIRAANTAMQSVMQTQTNLTQRARSMDIMPAGMINDVVSVQNRIQQLGSRVQQLSNIPVDLRTDETNRELESLRGQLGQITSIQQSLNSAMQNMDVGQINTEYQRLNNIVDSTERQIRDNTSRQDQFNHRVSEGSGVAGKLLGKIKAIAGAYLGIQSIKKTISFIMDSTSAQDIQKEAETKLQTVMRQRMGSSQIEFQAILDTASLQQQIGVIGDEVQLAGAQQVSTFLNTEEALKTLMPAMNNLAVQQHGVNVSSQDMVGIGNMVGKNFAPCCSNAA